jgi:hypothetical protein
MKGARAHENWKYSISSFIKFEAMATEILN